jgi:hypothetical protein
MRAHTLSIRKALALALALLSLCAAAATCSTSNHEGPDVTCQDLECGRRNACLDGIIASCLDGKTVKFHVCLGNADDICDEDWQIDGQFRCDEYTPDCESCWSRSEGCAEEDDAGLFSDSSP